MRPTKLTENLLTAFQAVLADELAVIAFTEEELVWQANQRLAPEEQISYRSFQRYKADIMGHEAEGDDYLPLRLVSDDELPPPNLPLNEGEEHKKNTELVHQVYITIKSALFRQKLNLVRGVMDGQPNWRRYSWMLERKFPDFKLKTLLEQRQEKLHEQEQQPSQPQQRGVVAKQPSTYTPPSKPLPEMEQMDWKWRNRIPWSPRDKGCGQSVNADDLYKLEHELALDEAATGYQNPWAHHGYLPDERREGGFYFFSGMGPDRLCHRRYLGPNDDRTALTDSVRELQWQEQEKERQQALATRADYLAETQHRQVEARFAARNAALGQKGFYEPERVE